MKFLSIACAVCLVLLVVFAASGCTPPVNPDLRAIQATIDSLQDQISAQSTRIAQQDEFISYLATRVPPLQPTPAVRPEPTPFVTGSVIIEDGRCCVGGFAGQTVLIRANFNAASPLAEIVGMRVRTGHRFFDESDFSDREWEPFTVTKTFEFLVPLNWTGFYISVQFRDALGNRSAVYTSDISVEGMPAPPANPIP